VNWFSGDLEVYRSDKVTLVRILYGISFMQAQCELNAAQSEYSDEKLWAMYMPHNTQMEATNG
jgi:hypothetical protein